MLQANKSFKEVKYDVSLGNSGWILPGDGK